MSTKKQSKKQNKKQIEVKNKSTMEKAIVEKQKADNSGEGKTKTQNRILANFILEKGINYKTVIVLENFNTRIEKALSNIPEWDTLSSETRKADTLAIFPEIGEMKKGKTLVYNFARSSQDIKHRKEGIKNKKYQLQTSAFLFSELLGLISGNVKSYYKFAMSNEQSKRSKNPCKSGNVFCMYFT